MHGQPELITARLRGRNPIAVWIETDAIKIVHNHLFPQDPNNPILRIDPSERLHDIDFRCITALTCIVGGCDESRVDAVFAACMEAKACRVIANVHAFVANGEVRTFRVSDSAGVFTWNK